MNLIARILFCKVSITCLLLAFYTSAAQGDLVNGNPSIDASWTGGPKSLDNGSYIRGAGNFGYDLYTTGYTIPSGSSLISSGWSIGDQVIAMGGKIATNDGVSAGWGSAFTGAAVNSNLTTSVRIVAKFGSSPTSWTTSTVKPAAGNGSGSFSGGAGGDGAILFATNVGDLSTPGVLTTFSINQRYDSTIVSSISPDVGRLIYTISGGLLDSWSVYLNTTILGGSFSEIPQIGDRVNLTLQRSSGDFTDSTTATSAVPEPSAFLFGGLVCSVFGINYLRNRKLQKVST